MSDVAPAESLTRQFNGRGRIFLQKKQAVSQAKGDTVRPEVLGEAEDVAAEPSVFVETSDSHRYG